MLIVFQSFSLGFYQIWLNILINSMDYITPSVHLPENRIVYREKVLWTVCETVRFRKSVNKPQGINMLIH